MNDPLAILSSRKELDSTRFGYLLEENRKLYGIDSVFPDDSEGWVDEKNMALWIPIADGNRRDGVGDLLEVQGIVTERHRKNPVVLFDHGKQVTLPIAMACERNDNGQYDRSKYTFQIDASERIARLNAYFYQGNGMSGVERGKEYDHALFTEQLFDMVAKRMLGAGSIGYQVIKSIPLQPDYSAGTPEGVHLIKILMLEGSLVIMPANMDTVQKCLAMPTICGKPISPYLVKSLTPHAGPKKVQMGHESKSEDKPIKSIRAKYKTISYAQAEYAATEIGNVLYDHKIKFKEDEGNDVISITFDAVRDPKAAREINEVARRHQTYGSVEQRYIEIPFQQGSKALGDELRSPSARRQRAGIDDTFHPGDTVTARIQLNEPGNITAPPIAMPGDRLKVISVNPTALNMVVERNGRRTTVMGSSVRKSLEQARTKSLDLSDVRKKYRTGKNLRRRLKRSSPGASVICVGKKDVDAVEEMAKDKGLKVTQLGTADGETRIKLIGDDASADEVAKAFGRPIGVKSLNVEIKSTHSDWKQARDEAQKWANQTGQDVAVRKRKEYGRTVYSVSFASRNDADYTLAEIVKPDKTKSLNGKTKAMGDTKFVDAETKAVGKVGAGFPAVVTYRGVQYAHTGKQGRNISTGIKVAEYSPVSDDRDSIWIDKDGNVFSDSSKSLNGKIKSMDDTELGDVETNSLDTGDGSSEPWGAQVLRKFHADHSAMMKDYDELLGPLEHEGVKAHVTKHLQNIEKALSETEKMWSKHYKNLPGLEGVDAGEAEETTEDDDNGLVEEKDADTMDDNANPAASNEPDLPAPEEVLEGMEEKGDEELDQEMKSLRNKYRMKALGKSVCPKCDGEPCKCKAFKAMSWMADAVGSIGAVGQNYTMYTLKQNGPGDLNGAYTKFDLYVDNQKVYTGSKQACKNEAEKIDRRGGRKALNAKAIINHSPQKGDIVILRDGRTAYVLQSGPTLLKVQFQDTPTTYNGKKESVMKSEVVGKKSLNIKKKSTEVPVPLDNLPDTQVPPPDWNPGAGAKLLPHHKAQVGEAAGFLKEIGAPGSQFDDEERMKSFHYHKTFEGMQQVAGDETGTKGVKGARFGMYQNPRGEWMIYDVASDQDVDGPYSTSGQAQNALGRWNREGHKSVPGSPEWAAEEANEPEHKGTDAFGEGEIPAENESGNAGSSDMFKTIGEASETFKRFSQEKAFGDPHREEANKMCKALEDLTNGDGEQKDDDEMNDLANEPGEMGQKGVEEDDELEKMLKKLKEDNEEQDKKMKALNRKLLSLNGTR